ncbi:GNAT family protein (plasmid) [Rhizobium sp. CB3171]|uniref:GNAT family N-acetyltransferase n=1 Tax=Rhizobium sp. CB3171 TaxID=3039157 RepID=UPI0024B09B6C|nr:GNAT family protein [Rhizobium sp. CB3171]WFU06269.1 GNAT family protein [Rhizobium sp. CB3171]
MVILKGANVQLRPASLKDAEARLALGTDVDIAEMFGVSRTDAKPMTIDAAHKWAQAQTENGHAWIIETDGRLIGEIKLHSFHVQDRRASMAVAIYDPAQLGKGFGTEAIRLLIQYAFTELKLHRIGIRVLAYNARAIRAYEKCGFVVEGRERETAFVNGVWHDDLMMGLLATEYRT